MSLVHHTTLDISFKHCDPAGIVFYPRYVEMVNDTVEHWFRHGLGCDFATLHEVRGLAIPVAELNVEFKTPSRLGDALDVDLVVERLGRSSATIRVTFRSVQAGEPARLIARLTIVFVDMAAKRPLEIPADLRGRAEKYLSP